MHSHAARIVVRDQYMRTENIGGDMNRTRGQRCGLSVEMQCPRRLIDLEGAHTVLGSARCSAGARTYVAGTAVAPSHVQVLLGGMRPCLLHIRRKRRRASLDERRVFCVHVVPAQLGSRSGIEDDFARCRSLHGDLRLTDGGYEDAQGRKCRSPRSIPTLGTPSNAHRLLLPSRVYLLLVGHPVHQEIVPLAKM